MSLALSLLGGFQATLDGQPVRDFPTQKARALLAYLALESGKPQPRARLCGLLWPEMPEAAAQNNLRKTLHHLHRALSEPSRRLFAATRQTIGLAADAVSTDVAALGALLAEVTAHPHRQLHTCPTCLEALERAAGLYRGELLTGLELPDAPSFEEWLLLKRADARSQALAALVHLADAYEKRGETARALDCVGRQLFLDPYLEAAHRQRMRLLAGSGQGPEALGEYELWRAFLAEEAGLEPEAATVALYEAIRSGAVSAQTAEPSPRRGFPAQFSPCLGREQELLELAELLGGPDCRLLTVLGPGGVGKTRLALALAERLAAQGAFAGGLYYVPLAPIRSPELLWSALASGLGLESREGEDARAQVLAHLAGRACLLVLDNFEQLASAAEQLADLVATAPTVRLLLTSRAPLNLRAEHRFPLEGLAYPATRDAEDALAYSAVQLFVEAARRVQPGFGLSPQNGAHIIAICRAVAGLPLGLELAATWTRLLDCGTIAEEIERNRAFLKSAFKDAPERHHSMAAVFAYSWELLPPDARLLLAQLSVFRGPFGLGAVVEVTGAGVLELATLLDHSLLRRSEGSRYDLHELLRQFAAEKLVGEGLAEDVHARHSAYFLGVLAAQAPALHGRSARQAVAALQRQIADIRQAWDWAMRQQDHRALAESLEGLAEFCDFSGLFEEAEALLSRAILAVRELERADLLSRLLTWQAHFLHRRGHTEAATKAAREALASAADPALQAKANNLLGEVLLFKGDYAQARVHQQAALAYCETEGGQALADALSRLGVIAWRTGDYAAAMTAFERALPLQEALGD